MIALVAEFVRDYLMDFVLKSKIEGGMPALNVIYEVPQWLVQTSIKSGRILRTNKGQPLPKRYQYEIHELLEYMLKCWVKIIDHYY